MSAPREAEPSFQGKAVSDFFQGVAPITSWPEALAQSKGLYSPAT